MITALLPLALALAAVPALAAGPYSIKDAVNCRTGPGRSYSIVKVYNAGDQVTLECQTEGESVNDNTIWDKTSDGFLKLERNKVCQAVKPSSKLL
ncbi:hypothetical protein CspHIS471_0105720 [Cutaneotrichosporon sp. HIS471]|nr:hypothetical protein CspHIS471_0105720 [Cutaneotrichosporon sp. HIS471]